jgi:hypothetical protein
MSRNGQSEIVKSREADLRAERPAAGAEIFSSGRSLLAAWSEATETKAGLGFSLTGQRSGSMLLVIRSLFHI